MQNQRLPLGEVPMNEMNNRPNPEETGPMGKDFHEDKQMDFPRPISSKQRVGYQQKKTMPTGTKRPINIS